MATKKSIRLNKIIGGTAYVCGIDISFEIMEGVLPRITTEPILKADLLGQRYMLAAAEFAVYYFQEQVLSRDRKKINLNITNLSWHIPQAPPMFVFNTMLQLLSEATGYSIARLSLDESAGMMHIPV